jgi:hypothetical protein
MKPSIILPAEFEQLLRQQIERYKQVETLEQPVKHDAKFGEIWFTTCKYTSFSGKQIYAPENHQVMVLTNARESSKRHPWVEIAVLSNVIDEASERDFILRKGTTPYGNPSMVELWNSYRIPISGLLKYIGRIENNETLEQLRNCWLWDKEISSGIDKKREKEIVEMMKNYPVGKSFESDFRFVREERKSTYYLYVQQKHLQAQLSYGHT